MGSKGDSHEELAAKEEAKQNANKTIETINEDGQKVVTQYDENGNKIKETFLYSDGEVHDVYIKAVGVMLVW